jgi:hypothetical protein
MAGKGRFKRDDLFSFARDSYLERTSRPIYAAIFLLPFIIFYETGTIFINTDLLGQSQIRVVAFVWLQNLLGYLGFGSRLAWMAPPLAVVVILTAMQITSKKRWGFNFGDVGPMILECVLLAVPLIVLSLFLNGAARLPGNIGQFAGGGLQVQNKAAAELFSAAGGGVPITGQGLLADIITGIGAGIYEELVFRLILICVLMLLFQDIFKISRRDSIVLSVIISAALFSAHHHIVFLEGQFNGNRPFEWTEFIFRTIAGVYFAVLFAVRGFGITAGTHAFYDTIAVFVNAFFFQQ